MSETRNHSIIIVHNISSRTESIHALNTYDRVHIYDEYNNLYGYYIHLFVGATKTAYIRVFFPADTSRRIIGLFDLE